MGWLELLNSLRLVIFLVKRFWLVLIPWLLVEHRCLLSEIKALELWLQLVDWARLINRDTRSEDSLLWLLKFRFVGCADRASWLVIINSLELLLRYKLLWYLNPCGW